MTFDGFGRLSAPYRKVAYRKLTWPQREEVWREHVRSFIDPEETLTPMQKATLSSIGRPPSDVERMFLGVWRDSVVERAYKPTLTDSARIALVTPLCNRARQIFGVERAKAFVTLAGPLDRTWIKQLEADSRLRPATAGFTFDYALSILRSSLERVGLRRPMDGCTCAVSSWCECPMDRYCVNSNCQTDWGCGCGGVFRCDGIECAADM